MTGNNAGRGVRFESHLHPPPPGEGEAGQTKTAGDDPAVGNLATSRGNQTAPLIHCCSFCFGAAPTWRSLISPPLNSSKVGIDMMPYLAATFGFSSTFCLLFFFLLLCVLVFSSCVGVFLRFG